MLQDAVASHPGVIRACTEKKVTDPVSVMVRELGESGIALRATVLTLTVEENFAVCSDVRRKLVELIAGDPEVQFAYPHMQVVR